MPKLAERIETPRMQLRVPEATDAGELNAAVAASFTELTAWMPWANSPQTLEETQQFCEDSRSGWMRDDRFNLLMVTRSNGKIIGGTSRTAHGHAQRTQLASCRKTWFCAGGRPALRYPGSQRTATRHPRLCRGEAGRSAARRPLAGIQFDHIQAPAKPERNCRSPRPSNTEFSQRCGGGCYPVLHRQNAQTNERIDPLRGNFAK